MQTSDERRPSLNGKHPQTPSQFSSLPRPTVQTAFDNSAPPNPSENPLSAKTTTPEALNFYKQQTPSAIDTNLSSSRGAVPPAQSFDAPPSARAAQDRQLNASRSSPSIASPVEGMRKSSFKDLVAKFNQVGEGSSPPPNFAVPKGTPPSAGGSSRPRQGRSRTPTAESQKSSTRSPRRTSEQPSRSNKEYPKAPLSASPWTSHDGPPLIVRPRTATPGGERDQSQPSRQPLFGEVASTSPATLNPGYGIPRQQLRRGSEGSMHYPNPMFPHSRNRSVAEIVPQPPSIWKEEEQTMLEPPVTRTHARAASDMSGTATPRVTDPFRTDSNSADDSSQSSTYAANVRHSRYGFNGPFLAISPESPSTQPPSTPLASKHNVSPSKGTSPGQRLKAVIKAPAPKESPPLRSSRPRQYVSNIRSVSNGRDGESRIPAIGSPEKRRYHAVSSAEFATRRESIRRALRQSDLQELQRTNQDTRSIRNSEPMSASPLLQSHNTRDSVPSKESKMNTALGPKLKVETRDIDNKNDEEPKTADTTHTEHTQFEDDSPVLSVPGSFPEDGDMEGARQSIAESDVKAEEERTGQPDTKAGQTESNSRSIYSQVLGMRKRPGTTTSQSSGITGRTTPPPGDDAGTIQIMLGGASVWDQLTKEWAAQQSSNYTQASNSDANSAGLAAPQEGGASLSPSWTPNSDKSPAGHMTLDSDAYSVIHRVLDQYRESGVVSPEMVYEFQQHILETDPDFSDRDDIDSMTVAKAALEELIRDNTLERFANEGQLVPVTSSGDRSFSTSSIHDDTADHFPTELDGGAMAVGVVEELDQKSVRGNGKGSDLEATSTAHSRNPSNVTDTSQAQSSTTISEKDFGVEEGQAVAQKSGWFTPNDSDRDTSSDLTTTGERSSVHSDVKPQLPEIPETGGGLGFSVSREASPQTSANANLPVESAPLQPAAAATSSIRDPSPAKSLKAPTLQSAAESETTKPATSAPQSSTTSRNGPETPATSTTPSVKSHSASRNESMDAQNSGTQDQRRLARRRNLIKELVDTEFSFNQDMKVIEDIYKGTATAVEALSPDDRRVLFGNSAQVVEFSEEFLDSLKQAAASVYQMPRNNKWRVKNGSFSTSASAQTDQSSLASSDATDEDKDRKTFIGETFSQHVARMEKVYGDYLKNHDNANQRLGRLQNIAQVRLWLNECHTYAADITSAWDLDSLLVKPVQRILKYPLLLNSLLESTPKDHPDFSALESACKHLMDISHRINESKKRAELLDQVIHGNTKQRNFDPSLGLSKAFGRRTEKLRQQVGLSDSVEDPEYKAIYEKFGGQFFQLQIVMRDVEMYVKCTENFMKQFNKFIESFGDMIDVGHSSSPEIESKWRRFQLTLREMSSIAFADHESAIRKHCIEPMKTVLKMHEGPQKLIQKRKTRILEYAKFTSMKNRGEKIDKKTQEQGEQFMALNETLKEELPKLFHLTSRLVKACLNVYVELQIQWHSTWQRKIKAVLDEQQIPKEWAEVVESFNSDFQYIEAQVLQMGICNGSTLAEAANFLSPTTNFGDETPTSAGASSGSRPRNVLTKANRGASFTSDSSPNLPDYAKRRSSSSFGPPQAEARTSNEQFMGANGYFHQTRMRAGSAVSNPTSHPQQSLAPRTTSTPAVPSQSTLTGRPYPPIPQAQSGAGSSQNSPNIPQGQFAPGRPSSGSTSYYTSAGAPLTPSTAGGGSSSTTTTQGAGGIFSSAMPMSESPNPSRPDSPNAHPTSSQNHRNGGPGGGGSSVSDSNQSSNPIPPTAAIGMDFKVLFLAASLFEFNIERTRTEGGYPYLTYVPGEVFDVIGEKGELWLAKNQDDPNCEIGWIWEKHFAKLMTDEY